VGPGGNCAHKHLTRSFLRKGQFEVFIFICCARDFSRATMNDVKLAKCTVIRHSLLRDDEEYMFSVVDFQEMTMEKVRNIPEMSIVTKEFSGGFRIRHVELDRSFKDYFQDADGFFYRKPKTLQSTYHPKGSYKCLDQFCKTEQMRQIENQKKVLELVRQERDVLMYCAIKPAKRDIK